jgi:cell division topological specificity factor MinE
MNLFEFFRKKTTAPVARDRLQVLLAHERSVIGKSDLLATLQEEILAVIAKHLGRSRCGANQDGPGRIVLHAGNRR